MLNMYLSINIGNTSGDKKSVAIEEILSTFTIWILTCTINLPFIVTKNIPITIIQIGPFISTPNQIKQTRKLQAFL